MYEVRDQPVEAVVTRGATPAQEDDELQKLIDSLADSPATRASGTVTDIDLSAYSAPRTATLYIRNGVNVRFINGTLTRATSLTDAPLVQITGDSKLTLAKTAEISGNNFTSSYPIVEVRDGEIDVEGGKIAGNSTWEGKTKHTYSSVRLTDENARFYLTAGEVEYLIAPKGEIFASGGVLGIVAVYNYIKILGDVKAYCSFSRKEAYLDCMYELKPNASITLGYYYPDQTVAKNVPQDALNCFKLGYSDNITGSEDDYQLSYDNNSLVVRKKVSDDPIQTIKNVEPGTLPDRIPESARDIIEELTITGKLNGTDIVILQDMAKMKLRKLDISGCDIVEGGSAYYTSTSSLATKYYTANDEIGSSMFYQSTSLETVILPNSVTKLYGSSFHYGSVKSITIGPKVRVIDGGLCPGTRLEEIVLNDNSYFVLDDGFLYDAKRTTVYRAIESVKGEIKFPNSVSVIENSAFDGCGYITKVTLPSNLKEIKTACFSDCSSLTDVVFNANLSYLGYNCFSGSSALKTVDLSNTKVTYIYQSFYKCNAIETLLLPSTLETIWGTCFTSTKLNYISCPAVTPPTLEHPTTAFQYSSIKNSCRVVIPTKSMPAYKAAAGWKEFLKYESDKDPNLITTEDELQKRLDEIAAEKPSEPVTLTIAEGGIDIGAVSARTGCKAKITGGSIKVRNEKNGADFAYAINAGAEITFENITLDFGNKYLHNSTFLLGGSLTIGSKVTFQNIYQGTESTNGFFVTVGGHLKINSGTITANGTIINSEELTEVTINGGSLKTTGDLPTITGKANVYHYGGTVAGGKKTVIKISGTYYLGGLLSQPYPTVTGEKGSTLVDATNTTYIYAALKGTYTYCRDGQIGSADIKPTMQVDRIYVVGKNMMYGDATLPTLYVDKGSQIQLASAMTNTWIIDGKWTNFDLTEPYVLVTGCDKPYYRPKESDYSRMQFANLPDDVEAVYDAEKQAVLLQKKKVCDLQDMIDGTCEGEVPQEVVVPEDGVEVGCENDPLQCAVDQKIDGGDDKDEDGKPTRVICGCVKPLNPDIPFIRIFPYSFLTISNYNIRSILLENQYIQVYGTLIIDTNVYIYDFKRFIRIMPGGRVVWRDGHVDNVSEIVSNEGGTLEIEGDFDNGGKTFKNPEGGTLIIREGTFKGDIENHGTLIIEGGRIEGRIDNYGELTMRDCTVEGGDVDVYNHDGGIAKVDIGCEIGADGKGCIWSEMDIWIEGGVRVTDIHIKRGCRIHVIGKLTYYWRIHFFVINEFDIYVPFIFGDGYKLTEADCKYIEIELPEGYRWIYKDGQIVIVRIPYNVPTIVEYLEYFGPQGTPDKPWSFDYNKTNIDVSADWHVLNGYHLLFDGGVFTMNGGNIYIDSGATLWLKNITFKGIGHIYVYGTLCIDENVDFSDIAQFIHVCKGGVIRFAAQPLYNVPICIEEEHIVTGEAVVRDVKEAWLRYLVIDLPKNYRWIYKEGQIVIVRFPYNVPTIVEYLEYFGPQGTPGHPWSFEYDKTNIDVNADWHVLKDYHLLFDGGVFTMNGGNIYVDSGATLWLKHVTFKGIGHIYVSGTLYIDENVDFADIAQFIHIRKGGVIRFAAQPSYNVPVCIEEEHIVTGEAVVRDVNEAWLKYLVIDLPDGYVWEYDNTAHTVLIKVKEVDGILGVTSDSVQQDTYDLNGHKVDKPVKGRIYIRNGKKIVIAD